MGEWRNFHIYYTNTDRLIVECVYPLLQRYSDQLETCFWERHYAGGPHLRVRLRGPVVIVDEIGQELIREVESYISARPSAPIDNYSPQMAGRMMEIEDETAEPEDLVYRVNEVRARPYQRLRHRLASDEAATLLEDFLHDSMPLAAAILGAQRPRQEQLLRLYFLEALFINSDLRRGSVSFKSHWEGFAVSISSDELDRRIKARYEGQRQAIRELMLEVKRFYDGNAAESDPILKLWRDILRKYRERAQAILQSGKHITLQLSDTDEVHQAWQYLKEHKARAAENHFLSTLYGDERFMASIQYEIRMLLPRVLTNLLYSLVAMAGLRAIDKMALCYYTYRAVEDHLGCDLTDILRETVAMVVNQHAHRFSQPKWTDQLG